MVPDVGMDHSDQQLFSSNAALTLESPAYRNRIVANIFSNLKRQPLVQYHRTPTAKRTVVCMMNCRYYKLMFLSAKKDYERREKELRDRKKSA